MNAKVRAAKKIVGRCSIVLAVPFGTGCALDSSKTGPTEATTTTAEAWTTNVGHTRSQHVLTISLPVGVALDSVVLSARGSIRIGDGTNVKGSPDASSKVTNTGTGHTDIGVAAALQDVLSLGPITLHSGAQIDGSVTSAATVVERANVVVTGSITQRATLTPVQDISWTVTFPARGSDVTVDSGLTQAP